MFRDAGACYEDAEGMVWVRGRWRVEDGIIDPDQTEDALRLVRAIIQIGMGLRSRPWVALAVRIAPDLRTRLHFTLDRPLGIRFSCALPAAHIQPRPRTAARNSSRPSTQVGHERR